MEFTQETLKEIQKQFSQQWTEFWKRLEEGKK
jgi:hypothetical protein